MGKCVDLWTYQEPSAFSLTSGCVDHTKSQYANMPYYLKSIAKLAKLVGTDQIVWCFADPNHSCGKTSILNIRYSLKVPQDGILAYMDNNAWETILHHNTVPEHLKQHYLKPWEVLLHVRLDVLKDAVALLRHPLTRTWIKKQERYVQAPGRARIS